MAGRGTRRDIGTHLEQRFDQAAEPFGRFIRNQLTGAALLLLATVAALIFANSGGHDWYEALLHSQFGFTFNDQAFHRSIHYWINDGLMVLFFFLLGLEIKREFLVGELKSLKQASPVLMAAFGGMLVPAAIFALVNIGTDTSHGWGVPMATDAAFAIGALAVLRSRVPPGLKVFLVALAIVDDIGAIIVIALFYSGDVNPAMMLYVLAVLALLAALNALGFRQPLPYFITALALWYFISLSGIHATIAGVLAAMAIPARPRLNPDYLAGRLHDAASNLRVSDDRAAKDGILADGDRHQLLERVERGAKAARTPLRSWENSLELPVSTLVIPAFAFMNAGIAVEAETLDSLGDSTVAWGVVAGLVLGKPIGIFLCTWLNIKLGWGRLPEGVNMSHIAGIGLLAGMGFTMSIFIAGLSFGDNEEALLEAKIAIMLATIVAGLLGMLWLWRLSYGAGSMQNSDQTKKVTA